MKSIVYALLFFLTLPAVAQEAEFNNTVFDPAVRTVIFQRDISIYDPTPFLVLGGGQRLKLSFDQLSPTNEFFNFTVQHCDHNWNPSQLAPMDYIEGSLMGEITDFNFSTNTYVKYTHYSMYFPSRDMTVTKSGNYILKVFRNFDETDLVLTRRFVVVENLSRLSCDIRTATPAEFRFSHQEVDFEVDYTGTNIPNPLLDVNVTVMQNNSWTSAITKLKPLFVNGNVLSFNYEDVNLFPGTNEFRFFDIRSLRHFSNGVREKYFDSINHVVLKPVDLRSHLSYAKWIDYNGKRAIHNNDGQDVTKDGDYAMVHFYLRSKDKSHLGELYVYGELTDWQMKERFKMKYWPEYEMYSCSVLLKQSYYDYHVVLRNAEGEIDYSFTEGNHPETENDYTILVYHKNPLYGYDQVIGILQYNSSTR